MTDTKKPLFDEALTGNTSNNGSNEILGLKARLDRFETAKSNQTKILNYLKFSASTLPVGRVKKLTNDIGGCGNYLVFHQYNNSGVRLGKASFCKKHFLCNLCAIRRGAKQVQSHMRKLEALQLADNDLSPYLLTYTVKNGKDLTERYKHLTSSLKKLMQKRRDYERGRKYSDFGQTLGGVYSIEFTKSATGWHPHVHMVVLLKTDHQIDFPIFGAPKKHSPDEWSLLTPKDKKLEKQKWITYSKSKGESGLSKEWQKITKDSSIVDLRPIDGDPASGFVEVFKYALKFSDLTPEDTVNSYFELLNSNGSMPRFTGSFGLLHGVKVPDSLLDETFDDLPYLELFYKYSKSGYTLASAIQKKSKNEQTAEADERNPLGQVVEGESLTDLKIKGVNVGVVIAKEKQRLSIEFEAKAKALSDEMKRQGVVYFDDEGNRI